MKKGNVFLTYLFVMLIIVTCWIANLVKFCQCDFQDNNWKEEIIHGIGVLGGPAAIITMWF